MRIHDLSCEIREDMWYYGSPYIPFEMKKIATMEENGYIARSILMSTHMGTHVECDNHWGEDKRTLDQIDLELFAGKAKVLKFNKPQEKLFEINRQELINAGGYKLTKGDICILSTSWDRNIDKDFYVFESPFITIDAAEYLVEREIKLLALDFPMCGDPRDGMDFVPEDTIVPDTILYDAGIPCVVGLTAVEELPEEVFFCGCPLKLIGTDGAPLRAFAIEF
ncbi:cyclase family protein [Bacillota bacterium]